MNRWALAIFLAACLVFGGVWVSAQIDLVTFQAGEIIRSDDVNANFDALREAIAGSVASLNGKTGDLALEAGSNVAIDTSQLDRIVISATGGAGGITEVVAGTGLAGGGDAGTVTLEVAPDVAFDSEIVPTVLANDGDGSTLDADTLDTLEPREVAEVGHVHDLFPMVGNGVGRSDCAPTELEVLIEDAFGKRVSYRFTFITPGADGGFGQIRSDGSMRAASSNVASVTRAGVGSYCVAFTTYPGQDAIESTVVGLADN